MLYTVFFRDNEFKFVVFDRDLILRGSTALKNSGMALNPSESQKLADLLFANELIDSENEISVWMVQVVTAID